LSRIPGRGLKSNHGIHGTTRNYTDYGKSLPSFVQINRLTFGFGPQAREVLFLKTSEPAGRKACPRPGFRRAAVWKAAADFHGGLL